MQSQKGIFLRERLKAVEKKFFWRSVSLATAGLFFFSLMPYAAISVYEEDPYQYMKNFNRDTAYVLGEEGVLMKPELTTELGDRSDVFGVSNHVVKPGENLSSIAQAYGVDPYTISQNNNWPNPDALKSGTILRIPAADGLIYKVKSGDTLSKIASRNDIDLAKLLKQNEMESGYELKAGQEIIIPNLVIEKPKPVVTVSRPSNPSSGRTSSASYTASASSGVYGQETGGTLLFPAEGVYTQGYRYGHPAVDIAKRGGSPIYAAKSGTVELADASGYNGGYGNYVIINHGDGTKTLYAHFATIYVEKGQWVNRGQQLGWMGTTGRSTGVHLHFEYHIGGTKVNPKLYF